MDTKEKKKTAGAAAQSGTRRRSSGTAGTRQTAKEPARRTRTAAKPERKRTAAAPKAVPPKAAAPTPEVVYTPAQPFNRGRFLLRLATVVAVVIALVFGISIFFKVDTIAVSGTNKYTPYMVEVASGIQEGDNLLTLSDARISGKIMSALPYVQDVRIGIQLPDTVVIQITEMDVVYSVRDQQNAWWLINSEGRVVMKTDSATAGEHTTLLGIQLQDPVSGEDAVAADVEVGTITDDEGNTYTQTVSGSNYLSTALSIAQYLEQLGIIGQVASIDVTSLTDIELWYGTRYQVKLGDTTELGYKISFMNRAINGENGLQDYDSGVLDITFQYQDGVVYQPFE